MSFLDIPDQYAKDRGGWKSDKIMKSTYMQIYQSERVAVDDKIDEYFENVLGLTENKEKDEKYIAWLTLFDKKDSPESQKEYAAFVKMQHGCNTKK
jgi:tRNA A37 methylthiotransferase MiaB